MLQTASKMLRGVGYRCWKIETDIFIVASSKKQKVEWFITGKKNMRILTKNKVKQLVKENKFSCAKEIEGLVRIYTIIKD